MSKAKVPNGYNTVNPFIISKDALKLIVFLQEVFEAEEDAAGHTMDTDGLLLHSELIIGNSRIMIADRKPDWPISPSFLQVYVDHLDQVLTKAEKLGAKIVTRPTDFYDDLFSRFLDPWNNLWWVYQHNPQDQTEIDSQEYLSTNDDDTSWQPTQEMIYIHDTLLETMKSLGK
jgi:PhnB protein